MADQTRDDGGVEDGQFLHSLTSPRQAKRPVERTVEMHLDVLSKPTTDWGMCSEGRDAFRFFKALHGRLKSQRDGTGGKLTVDPPFSFRREHGTGKI